MLIPSIIRAGAVFIFLAMITGFISANIRQWASTKGHDQYIVKLAEWVSIHRRWLWLWFALGGAVVAFFWPESIFQLPWADENQLARFHKLGSGVGFSSQNPNQLIANIYFQNDAGDADIVVYSASGAAITTAGGPDQAVIAQLQKMVADLVREGGGLHFNVRSKEGKWFTIQGLSYPLIKCKSITREN
jgi:hypothetical protein